MVWAPNRNAVASDFSRGRNDATALRLDNHLHLGSQGSRSGNPGLEDSTALRLKIEPQSSFRLFSHSELNIRSTGVRP